MRKFATVAVALALLGSSAAFAQPNDNRSHDDHDKITQTQGHNDSRDHARWSRGDKLSSQYQDKQYEVSDWKSRHFRAPPRGYHWVRADDQYVLAAIATGVIADIVVNSGR